MKSCSLLSVQVHGLKSRNSLFCQDKKEEEQREINEEEKMIKTREEISKAIITQKQN